MRKTELNDRRIALADCNNFFVSCERRIDSRLHSRPVVVLSGNDGCIISRSNEVKALALRWGHHTSKSRSYLRIMVLPSDLPITAYTNLYLLKLCLLSAGIVICKKSILLMNVFST